MVAERVVFSDDLPSQSTADALCETEPRRVRWTTAQFQQMGDAGVFEGRRVQLIEGEILEMTAGTPHVVALMLATHALRRAFGDEFLLRTQVPLNLNELTDPEPDIAVVRGAIRDFLPAHPTTAELIVEISDSTLKFDQTVKASLYARAGINDYWIVNIPEAQLEVRRQPIEKADERFGWSYGETQILTTGQSIAPLQAPDSAVAVADLLP